jgi:hypothetical protein
MSSSEYLIDASTRHQIMLQRLSGGSFNKLKPLLEKLQKDIKARLSENPADFQMNRLTSLMRDIQSLFDAANAEASKQLNLDLEEFISYETDFQYRMLGNAVTTELTLPAIEQVVAAVTTAKAELISGGVTKRLTISEMVETLGTKPVTIENKIRAGIIEGKSVDQMVRDIMRVANQAHKRDVRTVVRTAFNLAGSEARRAVNVANSDVLIGERLIVTLDSRTSVTCYGLSVKGIIYKIGEGPQPPLHYGCRTVRVGVVDPRYAVPGIKGLKSARGDNGVEKIDVDVTFDQFLKNQSVSFQKEFFYKFSGGHYKYDAWKAGKISGADFVDGKGAEIDLSYLKSLDSITL